MYKHLLQSEECTCAVEIADKMVILRSFFIVSVMRMGTKKHEGRSDELLLKASILV
jgi:hypothetical protein